MSYLPRLALAAKSKSVLQPGNHASSNCRLRTPTAPEDLQLGLYIHDREVYPAQASCLLSATCERREPPKRNLREMFVVGTVMSRKRTEPTKFNNICL